jgi:hypothetical protein
MGFTNVLPAIDLFVRIGIAFLETEPYISQPLLMKKASADSVESP